MQNNCEINELPNYLNFMCCAEEHNGLRESKPVIVVHRSILTLCINQ